MPPTFKSPTRDACDALVRAEILHPSEMHPHPRLETVAIFMRRSRSWFTLPVANGYNGRVMLSRGAFWLGVNAIAGEC